VTKEELEALAAAGELLADVAETVEDPTLATLARKAAAKSVETPYRYARVLPFNPASPQQVAALIRHLGLKMPRKRGEDRETTEAKALRKFRKRYPVFGHILDYRERNTLLNTFASWPLDSNSRVHTCYGYHPSTWRLSSRGPNLQNIPKRSDLARQFRQMLVAGPGQLLVEADSAAIEAVLTGYCSGSAEYIRLARAGVHGWLTSHIVGVPIQTNLSDADLAQASKEMKLAHPVVYEQAKRAVHGFNYLLTPYGLQDEYPELFPKRKGAERLYELYWGLPETAKVRDWQRATVERAHKEKHLNNHFGGRHYFYQLYRWNARRKEWEFGDDAKRAVAYLPQSDAAFIQREVLLALWGIDDLLREWLRLAIHDSIVLEVPEFYVNWAVQQLHREMTQPWPQLGGLTIGCEVKVGPSLGEMKEV
jgi:DNA polymerase I-like protein with 3'-5' exonuclease and polymerase domains